jgi:chain length determinant protein tyrosine kinase EpsG
MTLKHYLAVLQARSWLIAAIFGLVLAAVVAVSLLMTPRYAAKAQVLVDVKSPDPVAGSVLPAHLLASYIATQVELIGSERVALRVVEKLALHQRPEWIDAYQSREVKGDESIELFVARSILRGLKVRPSKDSNLLDVSFTARDRKDVAPLANAFVDAYVEETVDIRVGPARQTREFFEGQAKQYRETLQKATTRLNEFRASRGLTTTDEREDIENLRLQQLQTQLTDAQNARIDASRRGDSASAARRSGTGDVTEVLGNPLIQSLKGELARSEARLQERSALLGSNHPEILRIKQEIESLNARISKETESIVSSLGRSTQVASQRESELAEQVKRQRAIVLANKSARETILTLQRDVDLAQRNYDSLMQRVTQASLESQATQANISVIARATTPALPSSPNVPLNLSIGIVLGSLLGALAALIAESFRGRIRFAEDLGQVTGVDVVSTLRAAPVKSLALARKAASPAIAFSPARQEPSGPIDDAGAAEATEPTEAKPIPPRSHPEQSLGEALIDTGTLSPAEVEEIAASAQASGVRFGDAAVASGKVTREELAIALSVRTTFPLLDPKSSKVAPQVVAAFDADHPFMDDLRMLRTQIKAQFRQAGGNDNKVVAIVSHGKGEGKTFTAANLAVSFAQLGDRTLLIDGDMRTGRMHQLFSLSNQSGLSTLLGLRTRLAEALQQVPGLANLTVMPAGPEVVSPSDLLGQSVVEQLIAVLARNFDVVIIDTPGAAERPDASLIVSAAKHYVVVARKDRTLTRSIEELTRKLDQLGSRMLGSVLVKA